MNQKIITIAIVEDNKALRGSLAEMVGRRPLWKLVGDFPDGESAILELPRLKPAIVLMDINLPKMSGIECVSRLTSAIPEISVIMITVYDDSNSVFESLAHGANGYLLKPIRSEQLIAAVEEVLAGGAPMSMNIARKVIQRFRKPTACHDDESKLTPREIEILDMLSKGLIKKEIALELGISYWTVQSHVVRIYKKLQVHSNVQAVAKYKSFE